MKGIILRILKNIALCSTFFINVNNAIAQKTDIIERKVYLYSEIPQSILKNIDKMGENESLALNEYEAEYLNYIFDLTKLNHDLSQLNVYFLKGKKHFFKDERDRYYRGYDKGVGGCGLYLMDSIQKEKILGIDAAIDFWNKFVLPADWLGDIIYRQMLESSWIISRQIVFYSEIPPALLENLDKMGEKESLAFNEYEAAYLNYIFQLHQNTFNCTGKQIAVFPRKSVFFKKERNRYRCGKAAGVNIRLYIFNEIQKEESGGYDAAFMITNLGKGGPAASTVVKKCRMIRK